MTERPRPVFDPEKCVGCGLCVSVCAPQAILLDEMRATSRCIGCYHCMSVCPHEAITVDGELGKAVSEPPAPDDFMALLKRRRSLRRYSDREVPADAVMALAEAVRHSPTGENRQEVHMTAVLGRERVGEISSRAVRVLSRRFALLSAPLVNWLVKVAAGRGTATAVRRSAKYFARMENEGDLLLYDAPALLVFHGSGEFSAWDCHIASAYVALHAETMGLGSCFNGFMVLAFRWDVDLKNALGIPAGHDVHAVMTLGYPDVRFLREVPREKAKVSILE